MLALGFSATHGALKYESVLLSLRPASVQLRKIDNYARFVFCLNHLDGLPFDESKRRFFPIAVRAKDMGDIVDHLTNRRVSATHRVKALKRGGWSVGKVKEQRVYWRGDSKPGHIDPDIRSELTDV